LVKHWWRVLCRICKRRARRAKRHAGQALAREFHEGWGKTKTATTIRELRQMRRKELRKRGGEMLKQAFEKAASLHKKQAIALAQAAGSNEDEGFGTHCFVIHNPGKVDDFFDLGDEIKVGGTGKILRAVERSTKVGRAIKRITKSNSADYTRLLREVAVLKMLDHPNIVKLFETFEDDRFLYLVLELCEGGDVLDRMTDTHLSNSGYLSEFQASVIMRACFMTLNYLHANGYVHRDMKPENIVFKDKHHDILTTSVRLVDFGYSRKLADEEEPMTTKVGSAYYIAPEVLNGSFSQSCDLWSCGALCYTMLCGYPPFIGQTDAETLNLIREGKFVFQRQVWAGISKPAKHLIRHLLEVDPAKRMPLEKALHHPWIKSRGVVRIERMRVETVDRLISFHTHHRLRRCAMLAVAYQLESSDIRGLLELFQGLDLNGDGLLTRQEFERAVTAIAGVDVDLVNQMILSVDADGSGVIDFSEFVAATLEKEMYIKNHAALVRAFRCFDQDDGGSLSVDEVMETLALDEEERADIEKSFKEVDINDDGEMDYGEFYQMLQREPEVVHEVLGSELDEDEDDSDEASGTEDDSKDEPSQDTSTDESIVSSSS